MNELNFSNLNICQDIDSDDEGFYFAHNPNAEAAVKSGLYENGYEHYRKVGYQAERIAAFDEIFYLDYYSDVREAVQSGTFRSGYEHYIQHGRSEGRFATISQVCDSIISKS